MIPGMTMSISMEIKRLLDKYFSLTEEEALDLYDMLDTLYNDIKSRYLEALLRPSENEELVGKIIRLTGELLSKEERSFEEELQLIALLDILSTDVHDRTIGFITEEEEI